jgi:murein DD-endopeptidase MepM/ murein hydrolase activator NlpD
MAPYIAEAEALLDQLGRWWLVVPVALCALATYAGLLAAGPGAVRPDGPSEPAPAALPAVASPAALGDPAPALQKVGEPSTLHVITGRIEPGGSIGQALGAEGVTPPVIHELAATLRPLFDFRRAQPHDFFALIRDDAGQVLSFEFQRGRRTVYRIERGPDAELHAVEAELPVERRAVNLGGVIETSLWDSLIEQGERPELANMFADIFVWDVDFSLQTLPGDEFRMVLEKLYDRDGFVAYGDILAAQYTTGARDLMAVHFVDADGYADYYGPDGKSLQRTFLRAPVRYSRISSRYSNSRLHPILKVRRPHEGIDYAAPTGTPVWAVADGVVVFRGWSGGLGRLVKVRHANGYTSYYGHLSRYGEGLAVGDRVSQKQVIAYVGSTGLATGPHLDFRLRHHGRFVNPLAVRFPRGSSITVREQERFARVRDGLMSELHAAAPALVLEAGM